MYLKANDVNIILRIDENRAVFVESVFIHYRLNYYI